VLKPIILNKPQSRFISSKKKYKAFVTGFRGGKTFVGCLELGNHLYKYPRVSAGYFAPSYPQIRDIFYPTIEKTAALQGYNVKINQSNKEVHFYRGQVYYGTVICRSLERPETIIGFQIGKALVDELDTMKTEKAKVAWVKIVARMSYNIPDLLNGISVTTTPEGYKFVYQQFKKQIEEDAKAVNTKSMGDFYELIHGSTYDNEKNLPGDYIPSLLATYPPQLVEAYLNGQFVNLVDKPVWHEYDSHKNGTTETVDGNEPLHVGIDFNVGRGCAVIHVMRDGFLVAVDEIVDSYDTGDTIRVLNERYPRSHITCYPDASGNNRKSVNATISDIALLEQEGYSVSNNPSNPAIKDRVTATNAMFLNAVGERRYKVNADKCPCYSEALSQQVYDKNGLPEKGEGKGDDMTDAGTYPIAYLYPIRKPIIDMDIKFTI